MTEYLTSPTPKQPFAIHMLYEHKIRRVVEFSETDAAGLVHFSNFFRYMESCEHAMFRSLGLSADLVIDGVRYDLPRACTSCTFLAPLRFEDEFEVHLLIRKLGAKSLVSDYIFTKLNGPEARRVAHGSITIVFALRDEDGALRATNVPRRLTELMQPAPVELLAELPRST